eukprot:TRINITY_DN1568_c0_g1_i1.p1 TRINITY_DN1568_c0_g1~~TRINITY_DN1568_c0_g1_i1.p1  ORF type:complete len:2028 (+),score=618.17 TRINITY_DN1568_c0_g1_i1:116-6085(+)
MAQSGMTAEDYKRALTNEINVVMNLLRDTDNEDVDVMDQLDDFVRECGDFLDQKDVDGDATPQHVKERISKLVSITLPKCVVMLLERSVFEDQFRYRVFQFFHSMIRLELRVFSINPERATDSYAIIHKMFNKKQKFYKQEPEAGMWEEKDCMYAKSDQENQVLIDVINVFGEESGFDVILHTLSLPDVSIRVMNKCIRPVWETMDLLRAEFIIEWVPEVLNHVMARMLNLTDQQLKETPRKAINKAFNYNTHLLAWLTYRLHENEIEDVYDEKWEKFRLEFALKCFRSQTLEKRLNAVSDIGELVSAAHLKDHSTGKRDQDHPVTKYLTYGMVTHWILDNKIIEQIFGTHLHPELVKRSDKLLYAIRHHKALTQDMLELIWNSSLDKQETLVEAIYRVIAQISVDFRKDEVEFLLSKIKLIPAKKFDKRIIELTYELCARSPVETSTLGLEILWDIGLNEKIAPDVSSEAKRCLIAALKPVKKTLGHTYLVRCIEMWQRGDRVVTAMSLFMDLLGPTGNQFIIADLRSQFDLIGIFLKEFSDYARGETTLIGLQTRLKLLRFLTETSALTLEVENADLLWECLVKNAKDSTRRDLGFKYFQVEAPRSFPRFESIQKHLLVDKWPQLDLTSMTDGGFECLESYFWSVNCDDRKVEGSNHTNYTILDFNLNGLDILWTIALEAKNIAVATKAEKLVNDLYNRLHKNLRKERGRLHEEYLARITKYLDEDTNAHLNIVERAVLMLTNFIQAMEKVPVKMTDTVYPSKTTTVYYYPGTSTKSVVHNLMDELKIPRTAHVTFQKSGSDSFHNYIFPHFFSKKEKLDFLYKVQQSPLVQYDSDDEEEDIDVNTLEVTCPSQLISKNFQLIDRLFQLLDRMNWQTMDSKDRPIGNAIWKLIESVPTNPEIHHAIHGFQFPEGMTWEKFLDWKSSFKLLYFLNLMEDIIESKTSASIKWCQLLEENGGLRRIYEIFSTFRDNCNGACVAPLLGILGHFLLTDQGLLNENSSMLSYCLIPQLISHLMILLQMAVQNSTRQIASPADQRGQFVVKLGSQLLVACLQSRPQNLQRFFQDSNFVDLFELILTRTPNTKIQRDFANQLMSLVRMQETPPGVKLPRIFILDLTASILPKITENFYNTENFFALMVTIIRFCEKDKDPQFWRGLFDQVWNLMKTHRIFEDSKSTREDHVLVGWMALLRKIFIIQNQFKNDSEMPMMLVWCFKNLLFQVPTKEFHGKLAPPMCKMKSSRNTAFRLLGEMCNGHVENLKLLTRLITNVHIYGLAHNQWNSSPSDNVRSSVGYVGLKNMGCTCYMNSLIQQLFMLPRFRKGVLSADCSPNDAGNIVFQFQRLFTHLQESQKRFFNPEYFVRQNKDMDGEPINVTQQMDVDEYFNMFCERLENFLKGKPEEKLLENTWSGKLTNQLICRGCPHRSERDDPFSTISLDIKNKSNILEALDLYVKGEMLEGTNAYHCEKCNTKRDTLTRSCIKTLPNTLIIHLKRFDFDYDAMRKLKLNDFCSFPLELDMEPYTTVGLSRKDAANAENQDEISEEIDQQELDRRKDIEEAIKTRNPNYYKYNLAGILVHRGHSESGHYYSYIKERITVDHKEPQWIEFNDKHVSVFDPKDIPHECFGGTEEIRKTDPQTRQTRWETVEKSRNAYMLFYERVEFIPPPKPAVPAVPAAHKLSPSQKFRIAARVIFYAAKIRRIVKKRRETEYYLCVSVPAKFYEEVWEFNDGFLQSLNVDKPYFEFVETVMKEYQPEKCEDWDGKEDETIQFATLFFMTVLAHSKTQEILEDFVQRLITYYSFHVPTCKWLCQTIIKERNFKQLLLACPSQKVRSSCCQLLLVVLKQLLKFERESLAQYEVEEDEYMFNSDDEPMDIDEILATSMSRSLSLNLLETIIQWDGYVEDELYYYDGYFAFFFEFAQFGDVEIEYLEKKNTLQRLIDFFLLDDSKNGKKLSKRKRDKKAEEGQSTDHHLIALISLLYQETQVST